MCKGDGETMDHLWLHCPIARELWDMVLALFVVQWVMPERVVNQLAQWQICVGQHWNSRISKFIHHGLMWCIRKE